MNAPKAVIGEMYRYPNSKRLFKLIAVDGWRYRFECGHCCTDTVFVDLIRVSTGIQVYQDIQTELFI